MAAERMNDLDGKTWTRYSISVWDDINKNQEERSLDHPAIFPRALVERLLSIFSRPGDLILDPFVGSGSTVVAAQQSRRRSIGIDLSQTYIDGIKQRLDGSPAGGSESNSSTGPFQPRLIQGDARHLDRWIEDVSVDFCVTSPPYWNILNRKRSADRKPVKNYGDEPVDLGNTASYELFLDGCVQVFKQVFQALRPEAYCCIVVMDLRKKDQFYPLHMDLSRLLEQTGFTLDDIIIWDRKRDYNHLRPLGYPYVFRVNKVHEFILIFQKRR